MNTHTHQITDTTLDRCAPRRALTPRVATVASSTAHMTTTHRVQHRISIDNLLGAARAEVEQHVLPARRQVRHVAALRERVGDVLGRLDAAQLDERGRGLERLAHDLCGGGLALGADDGGLLLLLGLLDEEARALAS